MVVTVLSQFCTLIVVSPMEMTSPSALNFGATIQSPSLIMRLADSWIPATNPISGSLNTSDSTAAEAPSPAMIANGSLLMIMARQDMEPRMMTMSLTA